MLLLMIMTLPPEASVSMTLPSNTPLTHSPDRQPPVQSIDSWGLGLGTNEYIPRCAKNTNSESTSSPFQCPNPVHYTFTEAPLLFQHGKKSNKAGKGKNNHLKTVSISISETSLPCGTTLTVRLPDKTTSGDVNVIFTPNNVCTMYILYLFVNVMIWFDLSNPSQHQPLPPQSPSAPSS